MAYLAQHLLSDGLAIGADRTAIVAANGDALTFTELERRSNRFARLLQSRGVTRQSRVVLCLPKCPGYVVAMFGALKADAIYVPVYEKTPAARLRQVLDDCRPLLCVVDKSTQDLVTGVADSLAARPEVLLLDAADGTGAAGGRETPLSDEPLTAKNIDRDIAYLMYTSGSTGDPKGVMVTHGNIVDYAGWGVSYFGLGPEDRILNTAPFYFDMSVFDIYCSLAAGARLCIATENEYLFPGRLIAVAEEFGATFWKGVSSLLSYLSKTNAIAPDRLPRLETVVFAGEPLPAKHLSHWMRTYPRMRFSNGYGPTEATGISICHTLGSSPDEADRVPLGRPCTNTEILILNADTLEPCATGEVGEICIRGAGVSAGYWNDRRRTTQRFLELTGPGQRGLRIYRSGDAGYVDEKGLVWLAGRLDDQVKFQGFRIELGDVASAVVAIDGVVDAAVMLLPDRHGNDALVAFLEVGESVSVNDVRSGVMSSLPGYMVPRIFHRLPELPRTERGKIDRPALIALHASTLPSADEPE